MGSWFHRLISCAQPHGPRVRSRLVPARAFSRSFCSHFSLPLFAPSLFAHSSPRPLLFTHSARSLLSLVPVTHHTPLFALFLHTLLSSLHPPRTTTHTVRHCPTPGCEWLVTVEDDFHERKVDSSRDPAVANDPRLFPCPRCDAVVCLGCGEPGPHPEGLTCAEAATVAKRIGGTSVVASDLAFSSYLRGNEALAQCPQCTAWVSRTAGCSHMRCICGCTFCFNCCRTSCRGSTCPYTVYEGKRTLREGFDELNIDLYPFQLPVIDETVACPRCGDSTAKVTGPLVACVRCSAEYCFMCFQEIFAGENYVDHLCNNTEATDIADAMRAQDGRGGGGAGGGGSSGGRGAAGGRAPVSVSTSEGKHKARLSRKERQELQQRRRQLRLHQERRELEVLQQNRQEKMLNPWGGGMSDEGEEDGGVGEDEHAGARAGEAVPLDAVPSVAVGGKAAKKKKKKKKKKDNAKRKKNARPIARRAGAAGSGGGEGDALDSAALLSTPNW